MRRSLVGSGLSCPSGLVCLDRVRSVEGGVYARVDVDGDARVGVETRVKGVSLRVEVSDAGPYATVDLPVAAMLGIQRWVPLSASLGVGLGGITVAPRLVPYTAVSRSR